MPIFCLLTFIGSSLPAFLPAAVLLIFSPLLLSKSLAGDYAENGILCRLCVRHGRESDRTTP